MGPEFPAGPRFPAVPARESGPAGNSGRSEGLLPAGPSKEFRAQQGSRRLISGVNVFPLLPGPESGITTRSRRNGR
jgi:hypothetical protein